MKRRDLVKHLERHGCYLDREGKKHTIYRNPETGRCAAVSRHREIIHDAAKTGTSLYLSIARGTNCDRLNRARYKNTLAKAISDQLSIPRPNV